MMLLNLRTLICLISIGFVCARPQFITFKDGKLGVNFAGYHAEVGLGGLLTGDAAHGGLSASAGTPFGQQAGAGIGGSLTDGRAGGGAYAGAAAGYGVGASAAIGGGLNEDGAHGGTGSEAHVFNKSKKTVLLSQAEGAGVESNLIEQNDQQSIPKKSVVRKKYNREEEGRAEPLTTTTAAPNAAFDLSRFFDFGFFTNLAAGFGGPRASPKPEKTIGEIQDEKFSANNARAVQRPAESITTLSPTSSTPFLISLIDYNTEIVPKVLQKPISAETSVNVRETAPLSNQPARQQDVIPRQDVTAKQSGTLQEFVESSRKPANQRTLFDDIFNIPISAITAVNQFLNNRFQQG